jgi:hypothetical protein
MRNDLDCNVHRGAHTYSLFQGANDRGEARMLSKRRQQLPADSGSGGGKQKRAAGVETRSGSGDSKRLKLLAQSAEEASAKERNEPYLAGGLPAVRFDFFDTHATDTRGSHGLRVVRPCTLEMACIHIEYM